MAKSSTQKSIPKKQASRKQDVAEIQLQGIGSSNYIIPLIAGVAVLGFGYAALKTAQVSNFTKDVDVGIFQLISYKLQNPIMNGIKIGVKLRIKNPTNQSYTFQHPSVEMGTLAMTVLSDPKTGTKQFIPNFNKFVLSTPSPTLYTIPAAGELITDAIVFEIPVSTCIQLLGSINWQSAIAAIVGKNGGGLKSLMKSQNFAIKPKLYALGLPLPIELPAFYMFK